MKSLLCSSFPMFPIVVRGVFFTGAFAVCFASAFFGFLSSNNPTNNNNYQQQTTTAIVVVMSKEDRLGSRQ